MNLIIVGTLLFTFVALFYFIKKKLYLTQKPKKIIMPRIPHTNSGKDNYSKANKVKDQSEFHKNKLQNIKRKNKTDLLPTNIIKEQEVEFDIEDEIITEKMETPRLVFRANNNKERESIRDVNKIETNKSEIRVTLDNNRKESSNNNNNINKEIKTANEDEDVELDYNQVLDKFCEYVKQNKLINIEHLSESFKTTKEETVKWVRELESDGQLIGHIDENGEYFYLTTKEIDVLEKILLNSKTKKFKQKEINDLFKEIVKENSPQFS